MIRDKNMDQKEVIAFHNEFESIKIYDNMISGKKYNNKEKTIHGNTDILEEKIAKKESYGLIKLYLNCVHETKEKNQSNQEENIYKNKKYIERTILFKLLIKEWINKTISSLNMVLDPNLFIDL